MLDLYYIRIGTYYVVATWMFNISPGPKKVSFPSNYRNVYAPELSLSELSSLVDNLSMIAKCLSYRSDDIFLEMFIIDTECVEYDGNGWMVKGAE